MSVSIVSAIISALVCEKRTNQQNLATEHWELVNTTGDTFTPRVFHTAELLINPLTGVAYVAVYGGFTDWTLSLTHNTYGVSIQNFAL